MGLSGLAGDAAYYFVLKCIGVVLHLNAHTCMALGLKPMVGANVFIYCKDVCYAKLMRAYANLRQYMFQRQLIPTCLRVPYAQLTRTLRASPIGPQEYKAHTVFVEFYPFAS